MNPSTRRALVGEQGARPQDAAEDQSVPVWAMGVRCRVDEQLHLLGARAVFELAARGCTLACCGALILTPQRVLRGSGDAVPDVPGRRERLMSGTHHPPPWWRRLGRRHPVEKPRLLVTERVESAGWAHWVTREAVEQGLREVTGFSVVLCGRRIAGASMLTPPQRCCWSCQEARAC